MRKRYISIAPLVQFVAGFLIMPVMEPISSRIGKQLTTILGCLLNTTVAVVVLSSDTISIAVLMVLAVVLGLGTSTILIQATLNNGGVVLIFFNF